MIVFRFFLANLRNNAYICSRYQIQSTYEQGDNDKTDSRLLQDTTRLEGLASAILIAVSSFVGIFTVLWLSSYILDEKFYKDEFQKLDASSSNFRLILFLVSLMSLITGGFILYLIANISM